LWTTTRAIIKQKRWLTCIEHANIFLFFYFLLSKWPNHPWDHMIITQKPKWND
jgi:hypothetical protein